MFYVYVLESLSSKSWYIGQTVNLHARLERHNADGNVSTAHKEPWRIIYYEAYLVQKDALGREKFLKSGSGWRFLKKQMRYFLEESESTK